MRPVPPRLPPPPPRNRSLLYGLIALGALAALLVAAWLMLGDFRKPSGDHPIDRPAVAKTPVLPPAPPPREGVFQERRLGFSLPIPKGWKALATGDPETPLLMAMPGTLNNFNLRTEPAPRASGGKPRWDEFLLGVRSAMSKAAPDYKVLEKEETQVRGYPALVFTASFAMDGGPPMESLMVVVMGPARQYSLGWMGPASASFLATHRGVCEMASRDFLLFKADPKDPGAGGSGRPPMDQLRELMLSAPVVEKPPQQPSPPPPPPAEAKKDPPVVNPPPPVADKEVVQDEKAGFRIPVPPGWTVKRTGDAAVPLRMEGPGPEEERMELRVEPAPSELKRRWEIAIHDEMTAELKKAYDQVVSKGVLFSAPEGTVGIHATWSVDVPGRSRVVILQVVVGPRAVYKLLWTLSAAAYQQRQGAVFTWCLAFKALRP